MGKASGHFARQRALISGGWMKVLARSEIIMLNIYEQHADPEGISYPGGKFIAEIIGHKNTNHVSRIRENLVSHGLISIVEEGGGRGRPCKVKLLMPPAVPNEDKHSQIGIPKHSQIGRINTPKLEAKHSQTETINTPKNSTKHSQTGVLHNKEEQYLTANTTASNSAGGIGGEKVRGILEILAEGESSPQAALRELHDSGQLPDWLLSGLPSHAANPEARFLIAKYFINLRMNDREPTPLSWRGQVGQMAKMSQAELIENLTLTIANNYVGLPRFGAKKTQRNGEPSNGGTEEFRLPERRRTGPSPPEK